MYGSLSELESNWNLLDQIYFVMETLPVEKNHFQWNDYIRLMGYKVGAISLSDWIEKRKPDDPYAELIKLRNEYETWREKNRKLKKYKKKVKIIYPKNYRGFWFDKRNREIAFPDE